MHQKTKMCRYFQINACIYGEECNFAHSIDEMRQSPDFAKTSFCKNYKKCTVPNCKYAHDWKELKQSPAPKEVYCTYFHGERFRCLYGDSCRYIHDVEKLKK